MLQALLRRGGSCHGATSLLQFAAQPQSRQYAEHAQPGTSTTDFGYREVPRDQKKNLVAEVFSSVASSYDVMNDLMSGGMHRLWKDRLVSTLDPFPGMRHLDVAGGTGDVAFRVLRAMRSAESDEQQRLGRQRGPPQPIVPPGHTSGAALTTSGEASVSASPPSHSAHTAGAASAGQGQVPLAAGSVVVYDINPEMLAAGRKKVQAQQDLAGDSGLTFVEGNAEVLPFPDASFDSYTIAFGIRNVTDRDAALREARRVLKHGGRFLCLEFSQVRQPLLRKAYDAYSFAVIPRIGGLVANDASSYQYLVESIRRFPDQASFASMIEGAGLRAVGYEDMMGGVVAMHWGFKL